MSIIGGHLKSVPATCGKHSSVNGHRRRHHSDGGDDSRREEREERIEGKMSLIRLQGKKFRAQVEGLAIVHVLFLEGKTG